MSRTGSSGLALGAPMAGHLQKAGHGLYVVRHRKPVPGEQVAGGAVDMTFVR